MVPSPLIQQLQSGKPDGRKGDHGFWYAGAPTPAKRHLAEDPVKDPIPEHTLPSPLTKQLLFLAIADLAIDVR